MKLFSFDTETHLTQPGLMTPPMVCASYATEEQGTERVVLKDEGLDLLAQLLAGDGTIVGQTIDYDFGVCSAERPELLAPMFAAVDAGRVISADVIEKLERNAAGTLDSKVHGGNGLDDLELRYLGIDRSAEKKDGWRKRYALLDGVPIEQWPDDAVQYPRRDARGTLDVVMRQLGLRGPKLHQWDPGEDEWSMTCRLCGAKNDAGGECPAGEPAKHRNMQCLTQEMRAVLMLRMASIWGMRTDPAMVAQVTGEIRQKHEESRAKFFEVGIVRVRSCNKKDGVFERSDDISLEWLDAASLRLPHGPAWVPERLADIERCRKALAKGRPIRFAEDKGVLKELVTAAYLGAPPMTDGGEKRAPEVSTSRDTLSESGDPLLEEYGDAGTNEKLFSSFVEVLESGSRVPICPGFDGTKATQRTSYFKPNLQQIPRKGGIRECFVPRGYVEVEESGVAMKHRVANPDPWQCWLYSSVDYASLELATLAQCCINLGFKSALADAINAGQDCHVRMAARVLGSTYGETLTRYKTKEPEIVDVRQSMKPVNYGLGGLMGPPKLVFTARKDGIYFCENAGISKRVDGVHGTGCHKQPRQTTWGSKGHAYQIPPTCSECLQLAKQYKELWYEEFPEMVDYHACTVRAAEMSEEGSPLESFGTGMLRHETSPNAASNHFFQNLAAQGAKHAAGLISRECYTDTRSVLYNNLRIVVFVHDETLCEIREAVAHECAIRQGQLMVEGMKQFVPDVRIEAEPALMRRWFKGADKALDRNGRLKPWWPRDWKWPADQKQMGIDLAA